MDKIHIKRMLARAIIGINPEERINKQDVVISVTLHADLSKACLSDNVEDTIDYKQVKQSIISAAESSQYFLIERLAQAVAQICLEYPRVKRADVLVEKPGALRFAKGVGVEISRSRE